MKVLQQDGFKTEDSRVERNGLDLTSDSSTICMAFNPYYVNADISSLASYATDSDDNSFYIRKCNNHKMF